METIDSALALADRAWRKYGIGTTDRTALIADLRMDLRSAAEDGISPDQLLGPDIAGFAQRLADEAGLARVPMERERLVGTTLMGVAAGAAVGYVLLTALFPVVVRMIDRPRSIDVPMQAAVLLYYGVPAIVVAVAAIIAVRIRLRGLPRIRETTAAMMVTLPLAGILITPVTMAFAWTTRYSSALPVVLTEIALVLAAISGATVLARRWALRDRTRPATSTPPSEVGVAAA